MVVLSAYPDEINAMNKIQRVSQTIRILLVLAIVAQISVWLFFTIASPNGIPMDRPSQTQNEPDAESMDLALSNHFEGMEWAAKQLLELDMNAQLWLSTPDMIIQVVIYWTLFLLFTQFYKGQIFSITTVSHIRRLGLWVLLWPLILSVYPILLILSLKLFGVLEHGEISISLGSDDLATFISGAMIMVIGWVMHEAARLKDEQELTI